MPGHVPPICACTQPASSFGGAMHRSASLIWRADASGGSSVFCLGLAVVLVEHVG